MASGDIIKTIGSADAEIGKITAFGHETVDPLKYLVCEGTDVSRVTYAKLFEKIGESFGAGDGSTTFGLPNLIDQFLRGNSGTRVIGNEQGEGTAKNGLGGSGTTGSAGYHRHAVGSKPSITNSGTTGSAGGGIAIYSGYEPAHTHSVSLSISSSDAETRPKNIAVKFYIRYEG